MVGVGVSNTDFGAPTPPPATFPPRTQEKPALRMPLSAEKQRQPAQPRPSTRTAPFRNAPTSGNDLSPSIGMLTVTKHSTVHHPAISFGRQLALPEHITYIFSARAAARAT